MTMILNENATVEELDSAVEAALNDDDVSLEAYDRLSRLRDDARTKRKEAQERAAAAPFANHSDDDLAPLR